MCLGLHDFPGGESRTCTIRVVPPFALKPPIFVFYEVGPFYQNHNSYLKSEVAKELAGEANSESLRSLRRRFCGARPTREDDKGNFIVPCGMKANSLFNDTLTITDLKSDSVIEIDDEGRSGANRTPAAQMSELSLDHVCTYGMCWLMCPCSLFQSPHKHDQPKNESQSSSS